VLIDIHLENFKNPVTGEDQNTSTQLSNGYIGKLAEAAKTKVMGTLTPSLNFEHFVRMHFIRV
jgi:hypothetical protein